MSVETHQTTAPDQESQLSKDQQAWADHHKSLWDNLNEPYQPANHDKSYSVGDYTFEPISKGEHPPIAGSLSLDEVDEHQPRTSIGGELTMEEIFDHNEQQEAKEKKGVRAALGAIATKIANVFKPKTLRGELSDAQMVGQGETEQSSEKLPRLTLVDIKVRALEIIDKTKYNAGLAKEIGVEVKDILAEKAKDTVKAAKDKAADIKDAAKDAFDDRDEVIAKAKEKAVRAKDFGIGFAQYAAYEGTNLVGQLLGKAAELAKNAPTRLSEHFTEPAPTSSDPENRQLNRRGKILVLGLGIAASAGVLYLGIEGSTEGTTEFANQVPLDTPPSADAIDLAPDNLPRTQLPVSPELAPDVSVEPTHADLHVDFTPEIATLEEGDNIWSDSMKMLKEGGFNGSEQDLTDLTNLLTEWRLKEMGITAEQATSLPVGTKLPMPEFADMQEIIAKAEQLKQ